jgi:hypothetical protein
MILFTKNFYFQDRELITPSTKMAWNDFENEFSESKKDTAGDWVLHHDNTPAHTVLSTREFLVKKNIPTLPHPPYNLHLAPCDNFGTVENIQQNVTDELRTLAENDFQYCYDQWKECWNHCVTSQGSYFEGDNV